MLCLKFPFTVNDYFPRFDLIEGWNLPKIQNRGSVPLSVGNLQIDAHMSRCLLVQPAQ